MRITTVTIACALLLLCTSAVDANSFSPGRSDKDVQLPSHVQLPPHAGTPGPPDWVPGPPDWTPGPPNGIPGPPDAQDSSVISNPEPSSIALGLVGGVTLAAGALRRRRARTNG